MMYDATQDGSTTIFWSTYITLNKIDKLEIESRNRNINILDNLEEYMKLGLELGLSESEIKVVMLDILYITSKKFT